MTINQNIQKLRSYPKKLSIKHEILFSACIVLLGMSLGLVAKMTDSVSIIGEIGTEVGIWVFAATMVAAFSRYPFTASINTFLFFLSMLLGYYTYGYAVLGFFPRSYFLGWLILTFISPLAGIIMWFSRAKGIIGIVAAALPTALLFAHGYPAFYTSRLALYISLVMGFILCFVLPRTLKQKLITLGISIPIAFLIDKLYLLRYLLF